MTITCFVICGALIVENTNAQQIDFLTYQGEVEQSDLVVIARPIATKETKESVIFDDLGSGRKGVPAIGLESTLDIQAVLKGDKTLKRFVLHHYIIGKLSKSNQAYLDQYEDYILFLKRESDDRYVPTDGQPFPRFHSIKQLN